MSPYELELAEDIRNALPASTYHKIAQKVSQRRGQPITAGTINIIVSKIRRNDDLPWTMPYVQRGPAGERLERFFEMRRNQPLTEENDFDYRAGDLNTLMSQQGMFRVSSRQHALRAQIASSPAERNHYEEAALDCTYSADKLEFRIRELRARIA